VSDVSDLSDVTNALRVLYVIPGKPEGLPMVFARRQIASIGRRGRGHVDGDVAVDTFYLASRTHPVEVARECARLREHMQRFQPDLVHAQYGTVTALVAAIVTSLPSRRATPLVITLRGSDINKVKSMGSFRSGLGRAFSQLAALRAARIICVSGRLRDQLWWHEDRAIIQPNGTNLALFSPMPRSEARAQLGWAHDDPTILFNAALAPEVKRLDLATAAAERAQKVDPRIRFVVLNGDVAPDRIPLYLNASDVLLMTSDTEGSPNIVREGLACGLPVVSVDVGDVPERLEGVTLSTIVPRDPDAIAAAVLDVVRRGGRSNGPEIMKRLSEDAVADRIIALYRDALASNASRKLD
jgi:glycosyltransferase involved in cell wall biosynthesis